MFLFEEMFEALESLQAGKTDEFAAQKFRCELSV